MVRADKKTSHFGGKKIELQVDLEDQGLRLDRYLKKYSPPEFTRSWIVNLVNLGCVLVNEECAKPSYRVRKDDLVRAELIEKETLLLQPQPGKALQISFEDERVLAVDKPAGLIIFPTSPKQKRSLATALLSQKPALRLVGAGRIGIVHRLDKLTSGLVLVAKDDKTFRELQRKFKSREIEKTYLGLCAGRLKKSSGTIDYPLRVIYDSSRKKRLAQVVKSSPSRLAHTGKARRAVTSYRVLEYPNGKTTLIEIMPRTGRFHQIRAHLAAIGRPILGDDLYGKGAQAPAGLKRMFLHAYKLNFELFGKKYAVESRLPDELNNVLRKLRDGVAKGS